MQSFDTRVRPDDPDDSMKIWCIDYGEFGVALIEGIDRAKQSQVSSFVERHGDPLYPVAAHPEDAMAAHRVIGKGPEGYKEALEFLVRA